MKVGDLVKLAPHCKNGGRLAIVVRTEAWERNAVWIAYVDGGPKATGSGYAMTSNLVLISEAPSA